MNTHNSIDNNIAVGTNNTLKVKTLVNSTKNIPDLSELPAENRWKDLIADPLETVFKNLIDVGFLEKWGYHDARTGKDYTYTPEQVRSLTASEYWELNVDYSLFDNEQQQERIKRKAKEKEKEEAEKAAAEQAETLQITTKKETKKKVTTRSEK